MGFLRVIAAAALALPLILSTARAPAACAGPSLDVSHGLVKAGKVVVVRGEAWSTGGCADEGGGCSDEGTEPVEPIRDIKVTLQRGGVPIQETTVEGPTFTVRLHTEGLTPGIFEVVAETGSERHGQDLRVTALD